MSPRRSFPVMDDELDTLCEASVIAQVERLSRTPTLRDRIALLRDLAHRVTLKLFTEIRFAYDALLTSK